MKKSLLKIAAALLLAVSTNSTAALFAKPNPKAQTYKTHEVADSSTDKSMPVVYLIREITPEALVKVYKATGYTAKGKVGVKVTTGESEKTNYLRQLSVLYYASLPTANSVSNRRLRPTRHTAADGATTSTT